jgi:biopolymer transport protein ExbD
MNLSLATRFYMERDLDQINVVPLVDVMLVLLVIVLTTATFITTGHIPVDLAQAKEASDRQDTPILVTLTAEGELFLNDQPISTDSITTALTEHSRESLVVIRADRVVLLERFVKIVDEIRGMGFNQVSLEVIRT